MKENRKIRHPMVNHFKRLNFKNFVCVSIFNDVSFQVKVLIIHDIHDISFKNFFSCLNNPTHQNV